MQDVAILQHKTSTQNSSSKVKKKKKQLYNFMKQEKTERKLKESQKKRANLNAIIDIANK